MYYKCKVQIHTQSLLTEKPTDVKLDASLSESQRAADVIAEAKAVNSEHLLLMPAT